MTEVLSQDEVDQLLSSIEEVDNYIGSMDVEGASEESLAERTLQLYDFRHPDRFSKEQMRTIEIMHETFSRLVTNSLSTQLRTLVDVHVASVHQITYEEFVKTVPNPTLFAVIDMQPFNGSAIIEIAPSITFSIIERLFGGSGGGLLNRELTEIEQSVSENIIETMLGYLREAWRKIVNLRPHLVQIETNPQLAQVVPPSEMMLMILFDCRIDNIEGMINIAIPYITIESVASRLSAHAWYAVDVSSDMDEQIREKIVDNLNEVVVDVTAILGNVELPIHEIVSLQKGDVIMLNDVKYTDPISVFVAECEKFKAIPGKSKNRLCVKVVESIDVVPQEMLKTSGSVGLGNEEFS